LPEELQETVVAKVRLFENPENHDALRVHKLRGRLNGRYSFSVTTSVRIVFCYTATKPKEAHLLTIGTHDVYDV